MDQRQILFDKYQFGNNSSYRRRYSNAVRDSFAFQGMCFAASLHVVKTVMRDREVSFATYRPEVKNLFEWLAEKQCKYQSDYRTSTKETVINELNEIKFANAANIHSRGMSPDLLVTKDRDRIIGKILLHRDRFPCGYLNIKGRNSGHALAFCSDKTFLYLYDPNYGFLRFNRSSKEELLDVFQYLNCCFADMKFSKGCLLYCKQPAKLHEPNNSW